MLSVKTFNLLTMSTEQELVSLKSDDVGGEKHTSDDDNVSVVNNLDEIMLPCQKDDDMIINKKGASILSSTMNLSNTIMGAGLLGLPYGKLIHM